MQHRDYFRRTWLLALVIMITLSCNLFSKPKTIDNEPVGKNTQPAATKITKPSTNKIQVDYLYTSNLITVIYPLYGTALDDFSIVTITNTLSSQIDVIVESEITGYTTKAIDTVEIGAGEVMEVRQNPRLIPEKLDELTVQKPAQYLVKVTQLDNGEEKLLLEETGDTLVYAKRDFPWSIPGFTQSEVFDLLASMVTPNDPGVEELIRKAANYIDAGIMWGGYGDHVDDDDGSVYARLEAIWAAEEQDYNLTYISTSLSFAPGYVQRIRLPGEVLEEHSGNCIETSLLYASAAEALKLETGIILIPGHAFLAVRTDLANANYFFIETTMIGRATFAEAINRGSEEWDETLPHLDAEEEDYGWVTVEDAWDKGISPLPWR